MLHCCINVVIAKCGPQSGFEGHPCECGLRSPGHRMKKLVLSLQVLEWSKMNVKASTQKALSWKCRSKMYLHTFIHICIYICIIDSNCLSLVCRRVVQVSPNWHGKSPTNYVFMYVCMDGWMYAHVCTCMHMYAHVCTCMHMYVCMHMYAHVCMYVLLYIVI